MKARKRRGQALVEYALVFPVFILVVMGVLDGGRLFLTWHQANGCARYGSRECCLWWQTTPTSLADAVQHYADRGGAAYFLITLELSGTTYNYDSRSGWDTAPPLPRTQPGEEIKMKVTLPFNAVFWGFVLPNEVSAYDIRRTQGSPDRA
jgi:hypothetical protein